MPSTADLKPGVFMRYNGEICLVLESEHRTPGNLRAFYQVKMRNIKTGKLLENRFRSGESVELVRVEKHDYQYIYRDGTTFYFMNLDNYEQIPVDENFVGDAVKFMKENQDVEIVFEGTNILEVELPASVNLKVTHTEPGVRGDTATNVLKPATLETGAIVQVPIFINEGDMIRVDTNTGSYMERIK